jgi:hypothetical protein
MPVAFPLPQVYMAVLVLRQRERMQVRAAILLVGCWHWGVPVWVCEYQWVPAPRV